MQINEERKLAADSPPHQKFEANDEVLGKLGYVVIDRTVNGRASGGVRFAPGVSVDEVASLARSMTYKWGFLNIPMGGAKAGIFADPDQLGIDRGTLMEAFGRSIAPLVQQQAYYPGIDLGTTLDDLLSIMSSAGRPLLGEQIDSSLCTALTVFETIRQIVEVTNQDFKNMRVAVEGFGKVGSSLVELLSQMGVNLVAVSTEEGAIIQTNGLDGKLLLSLKKQYGDGLVHHYPDVECVQTSELFIQTVDLLVPGARPHVINMDNIDAVNAKWIVPISNVPITREAEELLLERGTVVIPDFVANCGGILASNMLSMGFSVKDVQRLVERQFAKVVNRILQSAEMQGGLVREISQASAWHNHLRLNDPDNFKQKNVDRIMEVLNEQGVNGLWQRFAWRIYRKWPSVNGVIRNAAVDQYGEWGLGETLKQFSSTDMNVFS
jgi:glutamate dehydrogenase (NAD(P)+)